MRYVWLGILLAVAMATTGAWWFERCEAAALRQQRDRALAACQGDE